jgi:hypothetical protein
MSAELIWAVVLGGFAIALAAVTIWQIRNLKKLLGTLKGQ